MLKCLDSMALEQLFCRIAETCRLLVPRRLDDGTRSLRPWDELGLAAVSLYGEPLQRKPTSSFFPQTELLLRIDPAGQVELPAATGKPSALFGLDRTDLAGITFCDRFFSAAPPDDAYLRQREGALLIALTGYAGQKRQLLPLAEGNCDLEVIALDDGWLARPHTDSGTAWLEPLPAADQKQLTELEPQLADSSCQRENKLTAAAKLLADDMVPDSFWDDIAARCILCGGCNFSCPTCTCFCLQDRQSTQGTERCRVWDSCQLDAFMREASGHNPLGTEGLRTRRRIYHKLVADPIRWGELGCIACGRCDRACPTGIGIFAVVEELLQRYG